MGLSSLVDGQLCHYFTFVVVKFSVLYKNVQSYSQ
jgi:hypothetical protein